MKALLRYFIIGVIAVGGGLVISVPAGPDADAIARAAPSILPSTAAAPHLSTAPAAGGQEQLSIAAALASHRNPHDIQPGFFSNLMRSMERWGFDRDAAHRVAVALAGNPDLDTIAHLAVAGSLQSYMEASGQNLAAALAELVQYVELPEHYTSLVNERFGLLRPETEGLIRDKIRAGNDGAAQRLIQEALLLHFNPSLAAKIFVPRESSKACCERSTPAPGSTALARVAVAPEKRSRSTGRHRVASSASKRASAKPHRLVSAKRRR